jgi:hypothetical protein
MNHELFARWKQGQPPYDGTTLYADPYLPVSDVRCAVQEIVKVPKPRYGDCALWKLRDWYEHDGFILDAEVSTWAELEIVLVSDDTFYESRAGDEYMRVTWYPTSASFLLRYYPDEEDNDPDYPGRWGDFDFSGPTDLIAAIQQQLPVTLRAELLTEPTRRYFDQRYGG